MITVEDFNTVMQKLGQLNSYHTINFYLLDGDEFDNVRYDFVIINHTVSNNVHTYELEIVNNIWTGGYYITDENDDYISNPNVTYDDSANKLTIVTSNPNIKLILHCCNLNYDDFDFNLLEDILIDDNVIYNDVINAFKCQNLITKQYWYDYPQIEDIGVFDFVNLTNHKGVYWKKKINYLFDTEGTDDANKFINQKLKVGKVNNLIINNIEDLYLNVYYLDKVQIFNPQHTNGILKIDLTNVYNINSLKISVENNNTDVYNYNLQEYNLEVENVYVNSIEELENEINNGTKIIFIDEDITLTRNIVFNTDTIINCQNYTIDMNDNTFIINNSVKLSINNGTFINGNPVIIQNKNSICELYKCIFNNNFNTKFNNLGSIVQCEIDIHSLSDFEDFTTNITECEFYNNHNCILHSGELNIENITFINNDMSYTNPDNVAFLYQVDGVANITNSIFNIDYGEQMDYHDKNLMFAQALIMCGVDGRINNENYEQFMNDDNINWFNEPYNNKSSINCIYRYTPIEDNPPLIKIQPKIGFETKCLCYAVSNNDFVYKSNVDMIDISDEESEQGD